MRVATKRFGMVEVDPGQVLTFPEGLIGFPNFHEFVVMDFEVKDECVRWLQSAAEPELGFVAMDPRAAFPDYDPEFCLKDLTPLAVDMPDDLVVLSVVTVPKDIRKMTANLQAPLLINPKKRVGRQVIVASPEYSTKHYVCSALEGLVKRTG
jgi:flagellar assembly factor FliW